MSDFDLRSQELDTIHAIYQDLASIDFLAYSGTIKVPIPLEKDVLVQLDGLKTPSLLKNVASLPPISFSFRLPKRYPEEEAPIFEISTSLVSEYNLQQISEELAQLWRDLRDQVLFTMIDHLQVKAYEYADDFTQHPVICYGDQTLYDQLVTYDNEKRISAFKNTTFACEICQRDLKGSKCVRFDTCGHVFCQACLHDFFVSLILGGDVEKVHCPDYNCGKKALSDREKYLRLDYISREAFDFEEFKRKVMTPPISPALLSEILGADENGKTLFQKYSSIFVDHQHALIAKLFPMRLVTCPRKHCNSMIFRENTQDRLVVCKKCQYAFCNICRKSFHSPSIDCSRNKKDDSVYHGIAVEDIEIWVAEGKSTPRGNEIRCRYGHDLLQKVADEYAMDQMFDELLRLESHEFSRCPTCDIVVQRLEGCNKMRCTYCYTFFCHLCNSYLDQDHPYDHFKDRASGCYNRLFQGMPGTEDLG